MTDSNVSLADDTLVRRAVHNASRRSHSSQGGFMELDDLTQEAWLWVLTHRTKVVDYLESHLEGAKDALQWLTNDIYFALHRVTMKERYRKDGTKPGDYFTYKRSLIEDMLPEALDGFPVGQSVSDLNATVKAQKAPNESGDRLAIIADLKAGIVSLPQDDKQVLWNKYALGGMTDEQLGEVYSLPASTMNKRVTSAIKKLAKFLGSEQQKPRKQVISNATAAAVTSNQEGSE